MHAVMWINEFPDVTNRGIGFLTSIKAEVK